MWYLILYLFIYLFKQGEFEKMIKIKKGNWEQ